MNRDELLDKLAIEWKSWPDFKNGETPTPNAPGIWGTHHMQWECFAKGDETPIHKQDYLDRREQIINCPPDSEAPSWATHKMHLSTGNWYWFESEPDVNKLYLYSGKHALASHGKIPAGHRWQDTLTEVNTMTTTAHEDQFAEEPAYEAYARQLDEQLERDIATFQSACQEAAEQTEREFGLPNANSILNAAAHHMQERAATYDKPHGERSMGATVDAFSAITGHHLSEEQGWLFMQLLKAVRSQQGAYRADSYEDGAAYVALSGEAAAKERS